MNQITQGPLVAAVEMVWATLSLQMREHKEAEHDVKNELFRAEITVYLWRFSDVQVKVYLQVLSEISAAHKLWNCDT